VAELGLTSGFVDMARRLTELVGLDATFQIGITMDMAFKDA